MSRFKERAGLFWKWFLSSTEMLPAEIAANQKTSFEEAKFLSDLIGIIVRLAFVFFMSRYFWEKMIEEPWWSFRYSTCFGIFAYISLAFVARFIWLVWSFQMEYIRHNAFSRVLWPILTLYITWAACTGIFQLAIDISKSGAGLR